MFPPWRLLVLTPAETVVDANGVNWVQAELADGGPIRILRGHAPLLAETVAAPLSYGDDAGERTVQLEAGILRVVPGRVVVYTTSGAVHDTKAQPGSQ